LEACLSVAQVYSSEPRLTSRKSELTLQLASFAGCIHSQGQNLARLLKVSPESPKSYRM
jgi:hypothetical protein